MPPKLQTKLTGFFEPKCSISSSCAPANKRPLDQDTHDPDDPDADPDDPVPLATDEAEAAQSDDVCIVREEAPLSDCESEHEPPLTTVMLNDMEVDAASVSVHSTTESAPSGETPSVPAGPQKRKRGFCEKWSKDPVLMKFLIKKSIRDYTVPYCKFCNSQLRGTKWNMTEHAKSDLHKKNVQDSESNCQIADVVRQSCKTSITIRKTKAELRLIGWFASENVALRKMDTLVHVCKSSFDDSRIASEIALARTKVTLVIRDIFGPFERERLIATLNTTQFSFIVDESTDRSKTKSLVMIVRFADPVSSRIREEFFGLVDVLDATAAGQSGAILGNCRDGGLKLDNLVGIAYDGAAVNVGKSGGLGVLLEKELGLELFKMTCTCHSVALSASHAASALPEEFDSLLRDCINYIAESPKRLVEFKEHQLYAQLQSHRLLRTAKTRWLSHRACVERVLEQWPALVLFFTAHGIGEDAGCPRHKKQAKAILDGMLQTDFKLYLYFLAYSLRKLDELNIHFQSSHVKIHTLRQRVLETLKTMYGRFIKLEVIRRGQDFAIEPVNYVRLEDVDIGPNAEALLHQRNETGVRFKSHALNYYVALCKDMRVRFNSTSPILENLSALDPHVVIGEPSQSSRRSLFYGLLADFAARLVPEDVAVDAWRDILVDQWNDLRFVSAADFTPSDLEDPGQFWAKVAKMESCDGQPRFSEVSRFMLNLCALPHSSAAAERQFSELSITKTLLRNRLQTKTLNALMHVKQHIVRHPSGISSWEIDSELIRRYSSWHKMLKKPSESEVDEMATEIDFV